MDEKRKIIFFDGVCNLCNGTVDFLIQHNPNKDLFFSSLQSPFAASFLKKQNIDLKNLNTIYYYEDGQVYKRSEAVWKYLKHSRAPYRFLRVFRFIPLSISDSVYNLVARNRYNLLGKRDSCRIPSAEEKDRFIER